MIRLALYLLAAVLLLPAAIGLVDAWCYVMLGSTVSPIVWDSGRVAVAWLCAIIAIPVAGIATEVGAMDRSADE